MRHRSPARWLAPLALVTCAVAVYAVVQSESKSTGKTTTTTRDSSKTGATSTTSGKAPRRPRTYTVKPGDVLSAIAEKTGVSVAEIQRLNPSIDAAALRPGQKLRLRP